MMSLSNACRAILRNNSNSLKLQRTFTSAGLKPSRFSISDNVSFSRNNNSLKSFQRNMVSIQESPSASDAWKKSCYYEIDYTISEVRSFSYFILDNYLYCENSLR